MNLCGSRWRVRWRWPLSVKLSMSPSKTASLKRDAKYLPGCGCDQRRPVRSPVHPQSRAVSFCGLDQRNHQGKHYKTVKNQTKFKQSRQSMAKLGRLLVSVGSSRSTPKPGKPSPCCAATWAVGGKGCRFASIRSSNPLNSWGALQISAPLSSNNLRSVAVIHWCGRWLICGRASCYQKEEQWQDSTGFTSKPKPEIIAGRSLKNKTCTNSGDRRLPYIIVYIYICVCSYHIQLVVSYPW